MIVWMKKYDHVDRLTEMGGVNGLFNNLAVGLTDLIRITQDDQPVTEEALSFPNK